MVKVKIWKMEEMDHKSVQIAIHKEMDPLTLRLLGSPNCPCMVNNKYRMQTVLLSSFLSIEVLVVLLNYFASCSILSVLDFDNIPGIDRCPYS
jgi:hypothetical protein